MTQHNIQYSFQSVRMAHSLATWASENGIKTEHGTDFAKTVLATVRRSIRDNASKAVEVEKRSGEVVTKTVKEHETKQRATCAALLKLRFGATEEFFIASCPKGIQGLIRQDQAMAQLEKTGDGMEASWVAGSTTGTLLLSIRQEFIASRGDAYKAPAPKSEEQATLEECQLQGLE